VKRRLILSIFVLLILGLGTSLIILYGKGYRFTRGDEGIEISGTGLLVAKSKPDGAGVFINNHLTAATDSTINLTPAEYSIKIVKQGYFPWEKKIKIQKEVVSIADALLFSTTPKLESITEIGVENPVLDPSGTQIAFTVASDSARKNGVYVLDISQKPIITLQSASSQIADNTIANFSKSKLSWSPDGKQLLATISAGINEPTTYILDAKSFNQNPKDVTQTLAEISSIWQKQKTDKEKSQTFGLDRILKNLISENFKLISWSQDQTKILYSASQSAILPPIITPPLIGTNSTEEQRSIEKDSIYVYDLKEDKNFRILDSPPNSQLSTLSPRFGEAGNSQLPLTWFPDSKHLIFVNNREIIIMEYDGENKTVIYAGPFIDNYVFPWPDGSRLVILTNLGNQNIPPNLYTIGLK
jgi:Tol biopolymer transport system component